MKWFKAWVVIGCMKTQLENNMKLNSALSSLPPLSYIAIIGPPDVKVKSESGSLHVDFTGPVAEREHDRWSLRQYYGSWHYRLLYWKKGRNTEVTSDCCCDSLKLRHCFLGKVMKFQKLTVLKQKCIPTIYSVINPSRYYLDLEQHSR